MSDTETSPDDARTGPDGAGDGERRPPAAPDAADDGSAVVFTPDDVTARPPDRPPTDAAPESEKVGLIFERS